MPGRDCHPWASACGAARKLVITVAGAVVLASGIALLVLPGPAFVVIPTGLAILGLEFTWARRWLLHVKRHGNRAIRGWRPERNPPG